jgi:pyridoxamine 5'-phosphate oxidase
MNEDISGMRKNYSLNDLLESNCKTNPFEQFSIWFEEARQSKIIEANAMSLSTANKQGRVSSRIVLLKDFDSNGFIFYSNYQSQKGKVLQENPFASLLFFWDVLERQIRIEGLIEKIPTAESEKYFTSRPIESQLGAFASMQSSVIKDREELENKFAGLRKFYEGKKIPMPVDWGGYKLIPDRFEFWQGRSSRLHDRIEYSLEKPSWKISRLSP